MYSKLLVFGSIAKDEIMYFPGQFGQFIDKDNINKLNVSFLAEKLEQTLGGIATNITYNYKLLSDKPVYVLGSVGIDSQVFTDFFEKNNINTDHLLVSTELYSGTYKAITDSTQNQIGAFYYGANSESIGIDLDVIDDVKNALLVISANESSAFLKIQNQAIKLGIDYMYDPGMCLTWIKDEDLRAGIMGSKYLIANDYETDQILKRLNITLEDIIKEGIIVITTLGKDGVKYISSDSDIFVPSFKVDKVVDPTGAGDSFRGGFLAGILDGKSVKDSLTQGNLIASISVQSKGGVGHILSK